MIPTRSRWSLRKRGSGKQFVSHVVKRLIFFAGLHVFPTFVLTEFPLVLTLTLGVVSVKVGDKRRNAQFFIVLYSYDPFPVYIDVIFIMRARMRS